MPVNPFSHIDLRVTSLAACLPFYEALMPALGFTRRREGAGWKVFSAEGAFPAVPYVGLIEEPGYQPGATRIAFWAGGAAEVDRLGKIVTQAGGRDVSGPRACPEYSPTYYAVFFEDPCGNKLEVCFRES